MTEYSSIPVAASRVICPRDGCGSRMGIVVEYTVTLAEKVADHTHFLGLICLAPTCRQTIGPATTVRRGKRITE